MNNKDNEYEEIYNNCLQYFNGDELASSVMINKYLLQDREGNYIETSPTQTIKRCVEEFYRIEQKYPNSLSRDIIFKYLDKFKYIIPQGSPLFGIGNNYQYTSLANCFVVGQPIDSYGGILRKDEELAQLMKRRGGVGIDVSTLRPRGCSVSGAAKTSDGITCFMERYSNTTQEVAQGGRRGALMISIDCRHPQIEDFIKIKTDLGKVNGANISIKWSDDFLEAVKNNKKYTLRFPVDSNIKQAQVTKEVNAKEIWDLFVKSNHKSAEPGCLFWDTITNRSISDCYIDEGFETISTNPCLTIDTIISTDKGDYSIAQLLSMFYNEKINILTYNIKLKQKEYKPLINIFKTKSKTPIIKLEIENADYKCSNIYSLKCTPDHKIFTTYGYKEAISIDINDKLIFKDEECKYVDYLDHSNPLYKIKKYINHGIEDVYDLVVEDNHNFFANNILVHNCGEIPLNTYGSCILMCINLTNFVDNKFTNEARFNIDEFSKCIEVAVRLIDDLIDLEIEKIDKIIDLIKSNKENTDINNVELNLWNNIRKIYLKGRRVGLGITGLGDTLAYLNIKYNSTESEKIVNTIFKNLHYNSYYYSNILARERGCFEVFNWEKEKDNYYIKLLPGELQDKIKKYGRRNITLNTCAPAGSISILTKTTSGIEPVFKREYIRNRKLSKDEIDRGVKPSFVDEKGIQWISVNVIHNGILEWKKIHPNSDIKNSPYWKCEAGEIDWLTRVKIQSIAQKYIDSSISSTANLPENIALDEISNIYLTAWELKCKGITIYRENSRTGVLVDKAKVQDNIIEHNAPTRPQILPCDIHYTTIGRESWVLFVGLLNNRPYDIFGGEKSKIEIPKKFKKGWIKKNGKINGVRTYDLILGTLEESDERMIIKDIANVFNANVGSYTRLISASLRHGIPIKFICEQLYKDNNSDMFTFEKGIARTLKKYIKDGENATGICDKCNSPNLQYKDGCVTCGDCGYSKCN